MVLKRGVKYRSACATPLLMPDCFRSRLYESYWATLGADSIVHRFDRTENYILYATTLNQRRA
eukprot:1109380-Prorocentrum_minimum.AAC.1